MKLYVKLQRPSLRVPVRHFFKMMVYPIEGQDQLLPLFVRWQTSLDIFEVVQLKRPSLRVSFQADMRRQRAPTGFGEHEGPGGKIPGLIRRFAFLLNLHTYLFCNLMN